MIKKASKADYVAYMERWRMVSDYERSELRRTPMSRKLRQLASLMASASVFPRTEASDEDDAETWERWNVLRSAHRV